MDVGVRAMVMRWVARVAAVVVFAYGVKFFWVGSRWPRVEFYGGAPAGERFHGRVLDQFNEPVMGAEVVALEEGEGHTPFSACSDEAGDFSLEKGRMGGVDVSVHPLPPGYDGDASYGTFWFGREMTSTPLEMMREGDGSAGKPVIFRLRRMGLMVAVAEPGKGERRVFVPPPRMWASRAAGKLAGRTEYEMAPGEGHKLVVEHEFHMEKEPRDVPRERGAWRQRVSLTVPGGGLVVYEGDEWKRVSGSYVAPVDGYVERVGYEFDSRVEAEERDSRNFAREYLVRFADGLYGRVKVSVAADLREPRRHFYSVESWVAEGGERMTEFDEGKEIRWRGTRD